MSGHSAFPLLAGFGYSGRMALEGEPVIELAVSGSF